ncbi:MAG: enoyl-CoA hydratase/isomerase family protein [Pseudomonadales bacterium]
MSDTVLKNLQDGVLLLTLNRPAKKNAFNNEQWIAFTDAILHAQQDQQVNVVVVTGAGDDFSSGVDLSSFAEAESEGEHPFDACAKAVAEFDKPLLMAAKGIAVGGGATLTFHADILYVGESLRMRLPFANLGLVPEFASSYMLQVNIGAQRAAELFYTAEWINAERAVEAGIAARCYADAELLDKALEKAREISQWPVNALQETKRTLKIAHKAGIEAALEAERDGMQKQAGSPENIEAITAFLEKRKPDFNKLKS